ncbi:hypothetical protein ABZ656_22865 [Streptomyces sp. NPDC007095]|uniref:hypothetical protein n=1 Tax=Streptomyces sp. NPDC007095 TaxID=3154482 RepID=UPI0033F24CEB
MGLSDVLTFVGVLCMAIFLITICGLRLANLRKSAESVTKDSAKAWAGIAQGTGLIILVGSTLPDHHRLLWDGVLVPTGITLLMTGLYLYRRAR